MNPSGPSGLQRGRRNIFCLFDDDESGDEDFNVDGLNIADLSSSESEDESEQNSTLDASRSQIVEEDWVSVQVPEDREPINQPVFTQRNTESVQNIPGEVFFINLDLDLI